MLYGISVEDKVFVVAADSREELKAGILECVKEGGEEQSFEDFFQHSELQRCSLWCRITIEVSARFVEKGFLKIVDVLRAVDISDHMPQQHSKPNDVLAQAENWTFRVSFDTDVDDNLRLAKLSGDLHRPCDKGLLFPNEPAAHRFCLLANRHGRSYDVEIIEDTKEHNRFITESSTVSIPDSDIARRVTGDVGPIQFFYRADFADLNLTTVSEILDRAHIDRGRHIICWGEDEIGAWIVCAIERLARKVASPIEASTGIKATIERINVEGLPEAAIAPKTPILNTTPRPWDIDATAFDALDEAAVDEIIQEIDPSEFIFCVRDKGMRVWEVLFTPRAYYARQDDDPIFRKKNPIYDAILPSWLHEVEPGIYRSGLGHTRISGTLNRIGFEESIHLMIKVRDLEDIARRGY